MGQKPLYLTLQRVAEVVGGRTRGSDTARITDIAPVREAGPDQLGFLADRRYLHHLEESQAGALLVDESLEGELGDDVRPCVIVSDARSALVPLLETLHPPPLEEEGVHSTAVIGKGVMLGAGVSIGPYAVLGPGANVADRVRIGAHVVVGRECRIGEESVLHAHCVLYDRTVLGRRVLVHSGARLGADGFGFSVVDGAFKKIPQVGRVIVEDDVEIGANSCIDRGSIGDTVIGRGSKLDNLVHIAHNVRVGEHCAFAAQAGIAGSTHIGAGSVFGGQAGAMGHLEIGEGVEIGAQAGVLGNVRAGERLTGYPAREVGRFMRAMAHMLRLPRFVGDLKELGERVERLEATSEPGSEDS